MHGTDRTLRPELGKGGVQTHTQHVDGSTRPINTADALTVPPTLRQAFDAGWNACVDQGTVDEAEGFTTWLKTIV